MHRDPLNSEGRASRIVRHSPCHRSPRASPYSGSVRGMQEQKALLKEQDGQIEKLGEGVLRVKALAGVMKDELQEQEVMLEDLESDVDRADSAMLSMQKKMKGFMDDAKNSDKALWSIIACLIVLLVVLVLMVLS